MHSWSRRALSIVLALGATAVLGVSAFASSTYWDHITGGELPNATTTQGEFTGSASGNLPGVWFIDVTHAPLSSGNPVAITGGSFQLETAIKYWPATVYGTFTGGSVLHTSGFSGCTNQTYQVTGALGSVGTGTTRTGTGTFSATLTHYRTWIWWLGCVVYSASVSGSVSLTF
jgi:hypothetical protein